ncbi:hypothetical protein ABW22_13540 [Thiobacillus denitrificans]|uniref:PAS domain-containing protein n=1 Tax=Thiobacillus denitrificans TaxID=36861 RepID=A0A125BBX5_THIDE|nr:hypothetical protein ABW22_13540 [Thiobacillus denitrificans]
MFEHFSDALILADAEARVSYLNPAAERLLGLPLNNTRGHALDKVLTLQDGLTRQSIQIGDFPTQHSPFSGAFHLLVRNGGSAIPMQCSVALTRTGSGATGGYMIVLRNASDLQQHIDKLVTQSMHDEHSRLLRRAELVKRLWRLLQEADGGEPQAFMYLDLDNFKSVNDMAGHAAGDLAIRQIAARLKDQVRGRDTLARLGGMNSACCWSAVRRSARASVLSNCIGRWNPKSCAGTAKSTGWVSASASPFSKRTSTARTAFWPRRMRRAIRPSVMAVMGPTYRKSHSTER